MGWGLGMKWRSSVMPPLPTKWPRVMSGRKREGEEEETAPLLACLPPSPPNEGRKEEGGRIERGAAGGGKRRRERERERERERLSFFPPLLSPAAAAACLYWGRHRPYVGRRRRLLRRLLRLRLGPPPTPTPDVRRRILISHTNTYRTIACIRIQVSHDRR